MAMIAVVFLVILTFIWIAVGVAAFVVQKNVWITVGAIVLGFVFFTAALVVGGDLIKEKQQAQEREFANCEVVGNAHDQPRGTLIIRNIYKCPDGKLYIR